MSGHSSDPPKGHTPSATIKVPPPTPTPVEVKTKVLVRDVHGNATARVVLTGDTVAMARNGSHCDLCGFWVTILFEYEQSRASRI